MASIFLSYAREDLAAAKALASALERIGHSDVGKTQESAQLLDIVRQSVDERIRWWRVPRQYYFYASLAAAAQGDDRTAIQWLKKGRFQQMVVRAGICPARHFGRAGLPEAKANPRFQTIAAQQRAWQARERREMAPMLAEARQK